MTVVKKAKYFTTRIFFNALIVTTKLKQQLVWGSSFTFRGLKKYMTMCRFIPNFPYHRMVIKVHLEFLMIICLSNEDTVKILSVIYPWQETNEFNKMVNENNNKHIKYQIYNKYINIWRLSCIESYKIDILL